MSYSFGITAATKEEAKQRVAEEFEKTIAMFPIHARDKTAVLANAAAIIDQLADDDTRDITVTVSGYLSWSVHCDNVEDAAVQSGGIAAYAAYIDRIYRPHNDGTSRPRGRA